MMMISSLWMLCRDLISNVMLIIDTNDTLTSMMMMMMMMMIGLKRFLL
jgi:hypothetical protein